MREKEKNRRKRDKGEWVQKLKNINNIKSFFIISPTKSNMSSTSSHSSVDRLQHLPSFVRRRILAFFGFKDCCLTSRTCKYLNQHLYELVDMNLLPLFVPEDCSTLNKAVKMLKNDRRITTVVVGKGEHAVEKSYAWGKNYLNIDRSVNIIGKTGVDKSDIVVLGGFNLVILCPNCGCQDIIKSEDTSHSDYVCYVDTHDDNFACGAIHSIGEWECYGHGGEFSEWKIWNRCTRKALVVAPAPSVANVHLENLTIRHLNGTGVRGFSSFTIKDVIIEQCEADGVVASGSSCFGRCTNVEVRQCGMSGVCAVDSASVTLIGPNTTVHDNCTQEINDGSHGLLVNGAPSSTIQLVSPLTKEGVSANNNGGRNWGAGNKGDINEIKTISPPSSFFR